MATFEEQIWHYALTSYAYVLDYNTTVTNIEWAELVARNCSLENPINKAVHDSILAHSGNLQRKVTWTEKYHILLNDIFTWTPKETKPCTA